MPTKWRSTSPMIRCAWSLSTNTGAALLLPSLHTCGSHSDGWIDFGTGHDRREIAVEHLEVHAVLRHGVGREEDLELVELGIRQGFVEGARIGHGVFRAFAASEPAMIPCRGDLTQPRSRMAQSDGPPLSATRARR